MQDAEQGFEPVRFRPLPDVTGGLEENRISLDGTWRIFAQAPDRWPGAPLTDGASRPIEVPGQWKQQGLEIPSDQVAAMAREFAVPACWEGYRTLLRFDAVHAGATYYLNGDRLGHSENLFTPVEWEVTDLVRPGRANRLDLSMQVGTTSEALSRASQYAFHSLGGIPRSVHLVALPEVHVRSLAVFTELDADYRHAQLRVRLELDAPADRGSGALELQVELRDPSGRPASRCSRALRVPAAGDGPTEIVAPVPDPLKWSAEKPHLYALTLDLRQAGGLLERIEHRIGFRAVEVANGRVLVNGVPVKPAGACHHETDALSGRAGTGGHGAADVELLKAANLNYLRTSHYPPAMEVVEAADRLGLYVEVEAPFCWVEPVDGVAHLEEILTPTTAMVDFYRTHPSVIAWSIANESHLNEAFVVAHQKVKELDPTRLTTFNHPFGKEEHERHFDLANRHYPTAPYDGLLPQTQQPILLGEFCFPVCHEQTDVRVNPGLRELWGHGHAEPDSAHGREAARGYELGPMKPGIPPGAWTEIVRSQRVVGGVIWAYMDESFYFADGTHAGYAWHHGYWGLVDVWRRPKPEHFLSMLIFAPVWFPNRRVRVEPGQTSVAVAVENRYSFTNLSELRIEWACGDRSGSLQVDVPPCGQGEITVPVPATARREDLLRLTVKDPQGRLINLLALRVGGPERRPAAVPSAGPPRWSCSGDTVTVSGDQYALRLDRTLGRLRPEEAGHRAAAVSLPALHLTRYDFGDLAGPGAEPYELLPREETRQVVRVEMAETPAGWAVTVRDRYRDFVGSTCWIIDRAGRTCVSTDYTYTGPDTNVREIGIRMRVDGACDTLEWCRWSEWGEVFPADSICRTRGRARARRAGAPHPDPEGVPPTWPWAEDQTELGTADFRGIKYHVYEASLTDDRGRGVAVHADADAHVAACLDGDRVLLRVLSQCRLGQTVLRAGDRIVGRFNVALLAGR